MNEMDNGKDERVGGQGQQTVATSKQPFRQIVERVIEFAIVAVVIAAVWGLFSLPTVFFYVDKQGSSISSDSSPSCTPEVYTGRFCRDALQKRQLCIPGRENTAEIYIQSEFLGGLFQDQTQIEMLLNNFQSFIQFEPSPECLEMLIPFLCSNIFAACSDTGQLHLPLEQECVSLRDGICMQEWQEITNLQQGLTFLPDCETLPGPSMPLMCASRQTTVAPSESENVSNQSIGTPSVIPISNQSTVVNITCSIDFYLDTEAGYCKPACGQWKPFPNDVVVANAVLIIMSSVGIVSGVLIVAVSILKYKHMFKFPTVLMLYQSAIVTLYLLVVLIGYMDTQTFLCPSQDATESLTRNTPYCTLFGIATHYFLNQVLMIWVAHIAAVLWMISFPFKARNLHITRHYKTVHILILVAAIVLPIGFVAAPLGTGGFRPFYYPNTCVAMNSNMSYYTLILPLSILSATGCSLLVLIFWTLIRRKWKDIITALSKKNIRNQGIWKYLKENPTGSVIPVTALVKVLLSFLCYMTAAILGIASSASLFMVQTQYTEELTNYFICESSGINSAGACNRSYEALYSPLPTSVSLFLLGTAWQSVNILYTLNFKDMCFHIKKRISLSTLTTRASAAEVV